LLCGNRGNARFLVVAGFPRNALAVIDDVSGSFSSPRFALLFREAAPASASLAVSGRH
jgi:hypothetical protein